VNKKGKKIGTKEKGEENGCIDWLRRCWIFLFFLYIHGYLIEPCVNHTILELSLRADLKIKLFAINLI
jgi:hypothetical protein